MKRIVLFFLLLPIGAFAQSYNLYVQGDVVNIRSAANAQGAIIGKAKRLDRLSILEQANEDVVGGVRDFWYLVETPDGKTGYVFGNFTSLKQDGQKTEDLVLTDMFFGDCLQLSFGNHEFGLAYNDFGKVPDLIDDADADRPKYVGHKFRVVYNDLFAFHYDGCNPDLPGKLIKTETIVYLELLD